MHDVGSSSAEAPLPESSRPDSSRPSAFAILREALDALRRAILPKLGVGAALERLGAHLRIDCLLLTAAVPGEKSAVLHRTAAPPESLNAVLGKEDLALENALVPLPGTGCAALLLTEPVRGAAPLVLVCWRKAPGASARTPARGVPPPSTPLSTPPWTPEEIGLLRTVLAVFAGFREVDGLHRLVMADARFDVASGLPNLEGLKEDMERRIRRLDRDGMPATLIVAHIPGLSAIAGKRGFQAGEEAVAQCVALLRRAVRPTDILARLGASTFALWMDGADRFAAAERAERMTAHGVPVLIDPPTHLPLILGLVCREPGVRDETPDSLLERATEALQRAEPEGRKWRFSHEAP